ncbi:MAG TPA: hypothetical protein HA257_05780 [Candidatus Methanoperedenaceae archaeon]|nr:hypothetical protein [Candidatus Methanoperedenaceae archaeon]
MAGAGSLLRNPVTLISLEKPDTIRIGLKLEKIAIKSLVFIAAILLAGHAEEGNAAFISGNFAVVSILSSRQRPLRYR